MRDRQERERQTSQAIQETLDRLDPLLEALGINIQTVVEGRGTGRERQRLGILMPAETVEMLVRKAIELDEIMQS